MRNLEVCLNISTFIMVVAYYITIHCYCLTKINTKVIDHDFDLNHNIVTLN
jgi:hypothetical protein